MKNPTTSKWSDIKSDYTDDNGVTHIDAFLSPDDNEEGKIIALIVNGEVYYKDYDAMTDEYAQRVIKGACETKKPTGNDLRTLADKWVNSSFNMIQLNVYDKMCDNMLFEFIRQSEVDYQDFIDNYQLDDELKEYESEPDEDTLKEFCEQHMSFDRYQDEKRQGNYPAWGTVFEFKSEPSEEMVQSAIDAGFGVIEGMDDFRTTLFVSGAGYSFYAQHWIPLFLEMPWNSEIKEEFKGVKYEDQ